MLILERPSPRQPQTPVEAKTTGIGAGLVAYGTGAFNNNFEPVNSPTRVITPHGQAYEFASASSQYLKKPLALSGPLTFFALASFSNVSGDKGILSIGASTNDRQLLYANNANLCMLSGSGGTYSRAQSWGFGLLANTYYSLVGVVRSVNNRQTFINGFGFAGDFGSVTPAVSNVCAVGAYWTSGAASMYMSGKIAVWGIWDRALSDGEIMSLYVNPWQLFAPRRIPIPTPAAAGYTHPTLSAATATEITATSFKPRVTYTFA